LKIIFRVGDPFIKKTFIFMGGATATVTSHLIFLLEKITF